MNQHEAQLYRARKAAEYKFVRGWTHKQIAEELDVTTRTVSEYLNDPPEELADPIEHLKDELVLGTVSRLREQLSAAEQRAREAEQPRKVFARDEEGNLKAREIPLEGGGTTWVPVVEGMELGPDHSARAAARQEERRIIEMLWSLAGVESPEEVAVSGPDGGALEVVVERSAYEDD
jgi:transcriptional regulator with XRE-family HTH domain